MKTENFKFLFHLVLLTFLTVPVAVADTTVTGVGDPVTDIPAVQAAVDAGGVVTLKGAFDFGYTGVDISNSVEIVGEDAIIENGYVSFLVLTYPVLGDVIIRDITLVNPVDSGILVLICENFLAERVNIFGAELGPYDQKHGIFADADWIPPSPPEFPDWRPLPNKYIKKFHVIDCDIDLGSYSSNEEGGRGISAWGIGWPGDEVDIVIRGNTVRNCSRHCVMVTDIAGTALIEKNILITGNTAFYPEIGPNGILTNQTDFYFSPRYQSDWAQVAIVNNDIESGPDAGGFPLGFGIYANDRDGLIIKGNNIKTDGGICNVLLYTRSNDSFIITNNKFSGSPSFATLYLWSATNGIIKNNKFKNLTPFNQFVYCDMAENNVFVGNNTAGEILTYYFDKSSANNTVKGHTGGLDSAVDLGTDNFLTGVTPMADSGGVGQQISQAMQELHERLSNGGVGPPNLP